MSVIARGESVESGGHGFARCLDVVGEVRFDEARAGIDATAGEGGVEAADGILSAGNDGVGTAELGDSGGGVDDHDVKLGIPRCRGRDSHAALVGERSGRTEPCVFLLGSGGFNRCGRQALRAAREARVHRKDLKCVFGETLEAELAVLGGGNVQIKGLAIDGEGDLRMRLALDHADPGVVGCSSTGGDREMDGQCTAVWQRKKKPELIEGLKLAECYGGEPEGRGLIGSRRRMIKKWDQKRRDGSGRRLRCGPRRCWFKGWGRWLETQQESSEKGGEQGNVGGFQGGKVLRLETVQTS